MIRRPRTLIALWVLATCSSQLFGPATASRALYSGTILSFGSGAPVANVQISAALDSRDHAATGIDGRFEILAPSDSVLELDSPGYRLSRVDLALYEGLELGVLALEPLATLSGRLVQGDMPMAGLGVVVVERFRDGNRARVITETRTDAQGRFQIERLSVPQYYTHLLAIEGVGPVLEIPELPSEPIDLGDLQIPKPTLVRGSVVDATGEPVANALVALAPHGFDLAFRSQVFDLLWIHSRTADNGEFEITVPPAMYTVVVYAEGHAATQVNGVQIGAGSEHSLDPLRLGASVEFGGRVTDQADAPIPSVSVTTNVYPAGGIGASLYPKLESVTDARGCYRLSGIPPDAKLNLRFTKPGYTPGWANAKAPWLSKTPTRVSSGGQGPGGCDTTPDQVLVEAKAKGSTTPVPGGEDGSPANSVDVTVVTLDERGLPIPAARVRVEAVDNQPLPKDRQIEADSGGRVRFHGVVPGRYRFHAGYRWGRGTIGIVTLGPSRTALNITATRRDATVAELTGRIGDGTGGPLAGAVVELLEGERWRPLRTTLSDAMGAFRLRGIPAGSLRVRASRIGYASGTSELLSLAADSSASVELHLSTGATVTGQIVGLEAGIQGVRLNAYLGPRGNERLWHGWVDSELRYHLPHVAPGDWTVKVTTADWRSAKTVVHVANTDTVVERPVVFSGGLEISGTVSFRGIPVPYASVGLTRRQAKPGAGRRLTADAQGRFSARGIEPGTYDLFVMSTVLKSPFVAEREIRPQQPLHIEMKGAVLEGFVIDRSTGERLPNAAIRLRPLQSLGADTYPDFPRVDAQGHFRVGPLTAGAWDIDTTAPGHAKETVRVNLTHENAPEVIIALEASPGLQLILRRLNGEPLEDAHLVWIGEATRTLDSLVFLYGRPDFHWQDIPLGRGTLQASAHSGWLATRTKIDNDGTPIALILAPAGRLTLQVAALADDPTPAVLRIFDADGLPVAGPTFYRPSLFEWTRDDDGLFRVFALVPGEYRAVVTTDDGRRWEDTIRIVGLETERSVLQ